MSPRISVLWSSKRLFRKNNIRLRRFDDSELDILKVGRLLSTPFHKYGNVFGVRKLACALVRYSLLRRGNAREASFALRKRHKLPHSKWA